MTFCDLLAKMCNNLDFRICFLLTCSTILTIATLPSPYGQLSAELRLQLTTVSAQWSSLTDRCIFNLNFNRAVYLNREHSLTMDPSLCSYSREQLFQLRWENKQRSLPLHTYQMVRECGIMRRKRGRRGGTHIRRRIQIVHSQRVFRGKQRCSSPENLVKVEIEKKTDIHHHAERRKLSFTCAMLDR